MRSFYYYFSVGDTGVILSTQLKLMCHLQEKKRLFEMLLTTLTFPLFVCWLFS